MPAGLTAVSPPTRPPTSALATGISWTTIISAAVAGTLGDWRQVSGALPAPLAAMIVGVANTGVDKTTLAIATGAAGFQVDTNIQLMGGTGTELTYVIPFFLPTGTIVWFACANLDNANVNQIRLWQSLLLR